MKNEQENNEIEKGAEDKNEQGETVVGDGEFKLTVRKLELPVRPRGVLAE